MFNESNLEKSQDKKISLIYLVNNLGFFVSHRLSLATYAKDNGYNVSIIAGSGGSETLEDYAEKVMASCDISFRRLKFRGSSFHIFEDVIGFVQLFILLYRSSPNLIHCISPKGVLYGGLASRFMRKSARVFSISGMGTLFTDLDSKSAFMKMLSWIYGKTFSIGISGKRSLIIVQNSEDFYEIENSYHCEKNSIRLIPGVGVRISNYIELDWNKKEKIVLLPARMIWEKGIKEFVNVANSISTLYPDWKFVLAGTADYEHPSQVPRDWLEKISNNNKIIWIGHCENMTSQFKKALIVCLPSYREGFPKVLMEAAAAGCAVVTSKAVGCKEAIIDGVTGDLVEIKNEQQLHDKLLRLIENPEIIRKYGIAGREMAFENYDENIIIKKTVNIYEQSLAKQKVDL